MSDFDTIIHAAYLVAAVCFVAGLHLMNSPASARRGNQVSAAGMVLAFVTTIVLLARDHVITATSTVVLIAGLLVGSVVGAIAARRIQMTSNPTSRLSTKIVMSAKSSGVMGCRFLARGPQVLRDGRSRRRG